MVDPRLGASQFKVVDIDEDEDGNLTTRVHQPGTTDVSGNALQPPKEDVCQPSPAPKTSPATASPPRAPRKPSPSQKPDRKQDSSPAPRAPRVKTAASPTCPAPPTSEPEPRTTRPSELSELKEQMQELIRLQSERSSSPPSRPASATSSEDAPSAVQPACTLVEFRAPYGTFRCQVNAIQRDGGLLALVYRAESDVQFIPAPGADVEVKWGSERVLARPHGLAFKLTLGHTYLVVLLSVVEPVELDEAAP